MVIWDMSRCTGCGKITHLAGSFGASEIKEGDTLNPITDDICKECGSGV